VVLTEHNSDIKNDKNDGAMNKIFKPSSRGQELVEFSLTLPILLLLVMLIVDLSRVVYYYSVVFNSAREGARYGAARLADTIAIENEAKRMASGLDIDATATKTEDKVEVETGYTFQPATPILWNLIGSSTIRLRSKATMQLEH
jgi:hypothetical protein